MRRREFITLLGSTVAWPLAARAAGHWAVVGFLSGRSLSTDARLVEAFRRGLRETGYIEGQNLEIEFRWADGQFDRLPGMVADLIKHEVSVIFAGGMDVQVRAVKAAISTTPAVYAVGGDPVKYGIVDSMNRPGGTATAVTTLTSTLWPKRLEILRELLPPVGLIGLLLNPNNLTADSVEKEVRAAGRLLGTEIKVVNARNDAELDDAYPAFKEAGVSALLIMGDSLMNARRPRPISLAKRYNLPSLYERRDFPAEGGLMSYGASVGDQYLQSGIYVGRILNGAKPADLPALQPTRFELVINLKTAKSLAITVPQTPQVAADEVIE
jgi:putative tryptophan/tyrosine transport system substrate-binding protein